MVAPCRLVCSGATRHARCLARAVIPILAGAIGCEAGRDRRPHVSGASVLHTRPAPRSLLARRTRGVVNAIVSAIAEARGRHGGANSGRGVRSTRKSASALAVKPGLAELTIGRGSKVAVVAHAILNPVRSRKAVRMKRAAAHLTPLTDLVGLARDTHGCTRVGLGAIGTHHHAVLAGAEIIHRANGARRPTQRVADLAVKPRVAVTIALKRGAGSRMRIGRALVDVLI